ncbi:molybdenum cofactor biosynthesis protein MoaE [Sphingomicrobium sp. XHP0239]|uniref:molybdenum cofactor biosynthesis protein MoaE n=1 Tax=Sphingomicrobium maritimum TaxID=3133972 RepID=UPI0031CC5121
MTVTVQATSFDPGEALAAFLPRAGEGAVASFVGTVRGDGIDMLTLDHYPGFTERALQTIASEIRETFALTAVQIIHRYGTMTPAQPIMFAATAAPHRRAALDALDTLMERLKHDAPFWKRETGPDGDRWLEPPPRL